jgi:hypothetical protein
MLTHAAPLQTPTPPDGAAEVMDARAAAAYARLVCRLSGIAKF